MLRTLIDTAATAALLLLANPAQAHHGWSFYPIDIEMDVEVTELKLINPHDRIIAVDADGKEWNLLLAPPARNRRFEFGPDDISVGDKIRVVGRRHRSKPEAKVHYIERDGERIYTYRYDSGISSEERLRRR